ncbi:unnamed protein product [Nezara viridula]|uniref:Uncharacterized protein n=1 Tax=Nezara viridula TaxID=85310 RepID=A0A9P0HLS6_NEZVI|nr:unnamed protein product [Nezara viridula]
MTCRTRLTRGRVTCHCATSRSVTWVGRGLSGQGTKHAYSHPHSSSIYPLYSIFTPISTTKLMFPHLQLRLSPLLYPYFYYYTPFLSYFDRNGDNFPVFRYRYPIPNTLAYNRTTADS